MADQVHNIPDRTFGMEAFFLNEENNFGWVPVWQGLRMGDEIWGITRNQIRKNSESTIREAGDLSGSLKAKQE